MYILDFRSLCPDPELQPRYSPRSSSAASSPRTPGSPAPANHVSPGMLRDQTRNFLHSLMSDPQVLKVGWDFLSEDIRMLRKNSRGGEIECMAKDFRKTDFVKSFLLFYLCRGLYQSDGGFEQLLRN